MVARKILMIGPSLDSKGGMSTFAQTVLDAWNRCDIDVLQLSYYSTVAPGTKSQKLAYSIRSLIHFKRAIKDTSIVHINFSLGASLPRKILFALAAKHEGKKIVLQSHSSALSDAIENGDNVCLRNLRLLFRTADKLIVLTDSWKNIIESAFELDGEFVKVVPNGVRVPEKRVPEGVTPSFAKEIKAIYLGRLEPEKGVMDLLEAMSAASERGANFELTLAGSGEAGYVEQLKNFAIAHDLPVHFPGWVEGDIKNRLIESSDIFVLPSHREVFPMSLLEAMAMGLAPISTNCGAISSVIDNGKNGLICGVGDIEALTECFIKMCAEESFRFNCSILARNKIAEFYSDTTMIDLLSEIYGELIHE